MLFLVWAIHEITILASFTPSVTNKHKLLLDFLVHSAIHINIVVFSPSLSLLEKFRYPLTGSKTATSKIKLLKVTCLFFVF